MKSSNPTPEHCLICNTSAGQDFILTKNDQHIYRCSNCSVTYVFPQPTHAELVSIYTAEYFERGNKYTTAANRVTANQHNDLAKLRLLNKYFPDGKLLDVGCARGDFLSTAKTKGYDVKGIELSEDAAQFAREEFEIDVQTCELAAADLADSEFDIVTMWDVLEHLASPTSTLAHVSSKLKENGVLAFSTGNISSFWARLTRKHWQLLTPPQHLFFFDEASLTYLLEKHGFKDIKFIYLPKRATIGFILFKAEESFGKIMSPFRKLAALLNLNDLCVKINLFDIVTCIAKK